MRQLVICGAGGHAREIVLAARQTGEIDVVGLLDDRLEFWGREVSGVPILGSIAEARLEGDYEVFPGGVGDPKLKERFAHEVATRGWRVAAPIIHPSADVGEAHIGRGVYVGAMCTLTVDVLVGDHVTINRAAHLSHDVVVENFVTLSPGVQVCGNVTVGAGAFLGVSASVREKTRIGARAIVGGGSFVTRDVDADTTVGGVPAKALHR